MRPGDVLRGELEQQSIKASPGVPTPIRARVTSGTFRGAVLLGVATFDPELVERVLLTFDHLRLSQADAAYVLKAVGRAPSGQVGIEGEHHSREGAFFLGELLAAATAGFADASTQRSQAAFGTALAEPSIENAGKQGPSQAAAKTADHFAERTRNAAEYTEIEEGREIQILVQQTPTEEEGQ